MDTQNLPGGITATIHGCTVQLGGDTYPAKDAIKAAGFTYRCGIPAHARTRCACRDKGWRGGAAALTKLTEALTGTPTVPAPAHAKFPPTLQQQAILTAVATGADVVVEALAGTGKTATCELITAADPSRPILLIVFNKTAQLDAAKRMGRTCECRTFDSLGFAGAPEEMRAKFQAQKNADWGSPQAPVRRVKDIAAYLGLDTTTVEIPVIETLKDGTTRTKTTAVPPVRVATLAMRAVEKWCSSADPTVAAKHVPDASETLAAAIAPIATRVWEDIQSPTGRLRVTNGHLTKAWALTGPDLTVPGTGPRTVPALLLVDEAQDTDPVCEQVMRAQRIQTVWLGDSRQMIYEWRGCTNSLANVQVTDGMRLPLTQSWRFGPQIAEAGNAFLTLLGCEWSITGSGKPGRIGDIDTPDAVICRTNAGVMESILSLLADGTQVAVPKGTRADLDTLVRTVIWLQGGETPNRIHDDLAAYSSWEEVTLAVQTGDADAKVERVVKMVEDHGRDVLQRVVASLSEVGADETPQGRVIVTTAHKSKGLQWDQVQVGGDFRQPYRNKLGVIDRIPPQEELRLAYVTVTRARRALDMGSLEWVFEALGGRRGAL